MPTLNNTKLVAAAFAAALLTACGGGGGGGDSGGGSVIATDNSVNQWGTQNSDGYTGGNVSYGGLRIKGEWSTTRVLNKSGQNDAFSSTNNYMVLGIKFDEVRYYEYWAEFKFVNGKIESNGAFTPRGGYGVSRDGRVLTVDNYTLKRSFTYKQNSGIANGSPCIIVIESMTADEYELCRVKN